MTCRSSSITRSRRTGTAATSRRPRSPTTSGATSTTSPITARPASAAYQLRKFVRRHRVPRRGYARDVPRARRGNRRHGAPGLAQRGCPRRRKRRKDPGAAASRRRDPRKGRRRGGAQVGGRRPRRRRMRLEEAQAVRKLLQHVIAAARGEVLGRDVTVVDALAHAANAVSKEFEGRPLVEAAVRLALGKTYQSLAMNDEAREQLARALELRVGHLDENHVLIAEARRALGVSHLAAGDFSKAEPLIERAVAGYRERLPEQRRVVCLDAGGPRDHPLEARQPERRGRALSRDPRRHAEVRERRIEQHRRHPQQPGHAPPTASEITRARRRAFEQALAEFERSGHGGDSRTGTTKGNLAMALTKLGRTSEAETAYREAIAIVSAKSGATHEAVATFKANLAGLLISLERFDEAKTLAQASLDARRAKGDGKHYMVGQSLEMLASVQATTGDLEAAERLQREALSTYIAALGESAPPTVKSRSALASLLAKSGKLEDALTEAQAASRARRSLPRCSRSDALDRPSLRGAGPLSAWRSRPRVQETPRGPRPVLVAPGRRSSRNPADAPRARRSPAQVRPVVRGRRARAPRRRLPRFARPVGPPPFQSSRGARAGGPMVGFSRLFEPASPSSSAFRPCGS